MAKISWLISIPLLIATHSSAKPEVNTPSPEVFRSFAAAWLDFQDGHYAEAMRAFHDAAMLNSDFRPAITGMKACAQRMAMPSVVFALDRYEMNRSKSSPEYGSFAGAIKPGVAFWGVFQDADSDGNFVRVEDLEKQVTTVLQQSLEVPVARVRPLEYKQKNSQALANYDLHVLAVVSIANERVVLDFYRIDQMQIQTSASAGLSENDIRIGWKTERIDLRQTNFTQFLKSTDGRRFLVDFFGDRELIEPGPFRPKFAPASADEICVGRSPDHFLLLSTAVQNGPSFELFRRSSRGGQIKHSGRGAIRRYLYNGYVAWLEQHYPDDSEEKAFINLWSVQYGVPWFLDDSSGSGQWARKDLFEAVSKRFRHTYSGKVARLILLLPKLDGYSIHMQVGDEIMALLADLEHAPFLTRLSWGSHHSPVPPAQRFFELRQFLEQARQGNLDTGKNRDNLSLPYRIEFFADSRGSGFYLHVALLMHKTRIRPGFDYGRITAAEHAAEIERMLRYRGISSFDSLPLEEILTAMQQEPVNSPYLLTLALSPKRTAQLSVAESGERERFLKLAGLRLFYALENFPNTVYEQKRNGRSKLVGAWGQDHLQSFARRYADWVDGSEVSEDIAFLGNRIRAAVGFLVFHGPTSVELSLRELVAAHDTYTPLMAEEKRRFDFLVSRIIEAETFEHPWHGLNWYFKWLRKQDRREEAEQILLKYGQLMRERVVADRAYASYDELHLTRALGTYYLWLDHDFKALSCLRAFLAWTVAPFGVDSKTAVDPTTSRERLASGCAWLAYAAEQAGERELALAAAEKSLETGVGLQLDLDTEAFSAAFPGHSVPESGLEMAQGVKKRLLEGGETPNSVGS